MEELILTKRRAGLSERGSSLWIVLILLFVVTPLVSTLYEEFFIRSQWLKAGELGRKSGMRSFSEWISSLLPAQNSTTGLSSPLCLTQASSNSSNSPLLTASEPHSICRVTAQQIGHLPEPLRAELPWEICTSRSQQRLGISFQQQALSTGSLVAANNCLSLGDGFQGVVLGNLSLPDLTPGQLFVSGYLEMASLSVTSDLLLVAGGDLIVSAIKWSTQARENLTSGGPVVYLYSLTGRVKLPSDYPNISSLSSNKGTIKVVERLSDVPELLRRVLFAAPPPLGIILSL